MPVDASIYGQIQQPKVTSPMDALLHAYQLQDAQLGSQQKQQAFSDEQAYRQAAQQSGGDMNALQKLLSRTNPTKALELQKQIDTAAKLRAETTHLGAQSGKLLSENDALKMAQHRDQLTNVNTPEDALVWAQQGVSQGIMKPEQYQMAQASIQQAAQSPQAFQEWKQKNALGMTKFIELNKPTVHVQNLGGTSQVVSTPGLGGAANVLSNTPITQSADSVASNARALQIAQMQDARARELRGDQLAKDKWQYDAERGGLVNMQTGEFKPAMQAGVPVGPKDKPLNDSQAKSLLFGSRMQEADKVLKQLASEGTTNSIPGSRAPLIGDVISSLSSENRQMLDQAKRDFMTAVLRRESGASISSGEFATADRQYFPQIGDSKKVIEQKARNRDLAIKGVLVEVPEKHRGSITPSAPSPTLPSGWSVKER